MSAPNRQQVVLLLVSVFIISICSILYELLISSTASYFQGSSILHFSIVIGLFLSSMGIGSYLSKFLEKGLLEWFITFEVALSLLGGFSTFILYFAFSLTPYFYLVAFLLIVFLGILIGVEIPVLTRIMNRYDNLKDALANVLTFDYLGALIASVIFPILLLPLLGTMRTAFLVGFLNLAVAMINTVFFKDSLKNFKRMMIIESGIGALLIICFIYSFQIIGFFETFLYRDQIMLSRQTPYQQVVVTKWNQDTRLFINGNLQFSSRDEYRYHEALVHVPMALAQSKERILVLGGGDGMVTRELLKHDGIGQIEVVDLDPEITKLAKNHPVFLELNKNSFNHEKVKVYNEDAYKFVETSSEIYDVVIIDLPDPNNTSLGKLYSNTFYEILKKRLAAGAIVISQSTSPYHGRKAFWCINETLKTVFPTTIPYKTYVPTFGQWGFNLAFNPPHKPFDIETLKSKMFPANFNYKYLNEEMIKGLFAFDSDMSRIPVEVNRLDNQSLVRYYEEGWNLSR